MNLKDMFDRVLLKSGQYVLSSKKLDINIDAFRLLVEDSLAVYSRYSPHDVLINREIYYPRQYDFSKANATSLDATKSVGLPEEVVGRIPDWIATANPMRYGGGSIGGILLREAQINGQNELIDPIQSPWTYDKPCLTVSHSARYEIRCVFKHRVEEVKQTTPDDPKHYEVKTISEDDQAFLDHVRSQFMIGVARSRRAFTINDLPITMDADQMVADATELETKSIENMSNYQKFYLTQG